MSDVMRMSEAEARDAMNQKQVAIIVMPDPADGFVAYVVDVGMPIRLCDVWERASAECPIDAALLALAAWGSDR